MRLPALPTTFGSTRASLWRIATHVLARRRHALCGRFGLRATPGGFGTPAAGPEHETVRIAGTRLVRERTGDRASTEVLELSGTRLVDAAEVAGVDLGAGFEVGRDTPPLGDPQAALDLDEEAARVLAGWFAFGWSVLDATLAALGARAEPTVVQLWPEHFDAGCDVASGTARVNLGASPGDDEWPEPYLYVGPWEPERPGDPTFWNAPFGAALTYGELRAAVDPHAAAEAFLARGVALAAGG